jgi:hypothetical protein
MNNTIEMNDTDLKRALRRLGWMMKKDDGEYEIYPKGHRKPFAYFTPDRSDALNTAKAESAAMFESMTSWILRDDVREAVRAWHGEHGFQWKSTLISAWMTGNYRGFSDSATLQRWRNTSGLVDVNSMPADIYAE